jgi:stage V sporulation protein G
MKNHLRAQYCNQCGAQLSQDRMPLDADGRAKLYADIAHPINSHCREMIQDHVINEFYEEIERSKQPGYISRYDDVDIDYQDEPAETYPKPRESRVDRAHGRPAPHEPQANSNLAHGSSPRNASASKAPQAKPPIATNDTFGSGIFE